VTGFYTYPEHTPGLPYASQQQSDLYRATAQLDRLRERLGLRLSPFEMLGLWHKPKGMHWRTFHKLAARDAFYQEAFLDALERLL
jgi:hypothetical protein